MLLTVICQRDHPARLRLIIHRYLAHAAADPVRILDRDMVRRLPEAVGQGEAGPLLRHAGLDPQGVAALQMEAEYLLQPDPVHPPRRTRIPGPTAPPHLPL